MAIADRDVFDEPEDPFVPSDRGQHIGDGEHRDDARVRRGTIEAHGAIVAPACFRKLGPVQLGNLNALDAAPLCTFTLSVTATR
jgi:hypothetical protein